MPDKSLPAALLLPLLLLCNLAFAQQRYNLTLVRPFYAPSGLNDLGQIVGTTIPEGGPEVLPQGAVWTPGANPPLALLGSPYDVGNRINNAGQVAGTHRYAANVDRATLFYKGGYQDLGTLGGRTSTGYAINDSGQVAGFSAVASGRQHAFLTSGGAMRDLGTLSGGWSYAYGMNDKGQAVGGATLAPGHEAPTHAVVYDNGKVIDLGRFAAEEGTAYGINNPGQVVGASRFGNDDYHAFLWQEGVTSWLDPPGRDGAVAFSINDRGDVVGYSFRLLDQPRGFIYTDGRTLDLTALLATQEGWTVNMAWAINEVGDIAASACRPHPEAAGALDCSTVLMTPVPEPPAAALWACAALFGGALRGLDAWRQLPMRRPR